jgi:histidyl-tRNA synthetase
MSTKLQPVRGTHDMLPVEARRFQRIVGTARGIAALYGFGEIIPPVFEFSDVFHRTLGDTSDVVTKETYTFTDRGGDSITLRPEFTASLARAFISNGLQDRLPVKWYYSGPAFRYERPQKGRLRQFHQIGVEFLGAPEPLADVECIALAWRIFRALGLQDNVTLELNTLGDADTRAAYRAELVRYFSRHADKLSADSRVRLEKNPLRILDSKDEGDREVVAGASAFAAHHTEATKAFYARVKEGLAALSIPFTENPKLVRGLDYYNHTVFEFTCPLLGAQSTVLAGGRYDGLIGQMGGQDVPGVGWASGVERLMIALESFAAANEPLPRPVAVIPVGEAMEIPALQTAQGLREAGIACEMIAKGNIGKAMKKANAINAHAAVLVGEEEWRTGEVTLKMLDSGEQSRMAVSAVTNSLSSIVTRS